MREEVFNDIVKEVLKKADCRAEIKAKYDKDGTTLEMYGNPALLFVLCCTTVQKLAKQDPGHTPEEYVDVVAAAVKTTLMIENLNGKE